MIHVIQCRYLHRYQNRPSLLLLVAVVVVEWSYDTRADFRHLVIQPSIITDAEGNRNGTAAHKHLLL